MTDSSRSGRVLGSAAYPGGFNWLRVQVDADLARAGAGQWLSIDGARWPILRTDVDQRRVDCLARQAPPATDRVSVEGLGGEPFDLSIVSPRALLIGDLDGLAALLCLAGQLRTGRERVKALLLLEAEAPLPFPPQPSRIIVPDLPSWVIAALPLAEDWGLASRLACPGADEAGCFDGSVRELAQIWLGTLQGAADVQIFACGRHGLAEPLADLARAHGLAFQWRGVG